jgi:S-layer protein
LTSCRFDKDTDIIIGNLAGGTVLSGLGATNNVLIKATTGQTLGLSLTDATGTSDVVNINFNASAVVNGNTITVSNVETVNFLGNDAAAANVSAINVATLTANKATSIVVTGNDGLNLTATGVKHKVR